MTDRNPHYAKSKKCEICGGHSSMKGYGALHRETVYLNDIKYKTCESCRWELCEITNHPDKNIMKDEYRFDISLERYINYRKLYSEIKDRARMFDELNKQQIFIDSETYTENKKTNNKVKKLSKKIIDDLKKLSIDEIIELNDITEKYISDYIEKEDKEFESKYILKKATRYSIYDL